MLKTTSKTKRPATKFTVCSNNNTYSINIRYSSSGTLDSVKEDHILYDIDIDIDVKNSMSRYDGVLDKHSPDVTITFNGHGLVVHTTISVPVKVITDTVFNCIRIKPCIDQVYDNGYNLASVILSDMISEDNDMLNKTTSIFASPQSYPIFKQILTNNGLDLVASDMVSNNNGVRLFKFGVTYKKNTRINISYSTETRVLSVSIYSKNYTISHHNITSFEQFESAIMQIGWAFV